MTMDRKELGAALADVRRAYRLVHAYQRRLWDLLGKVDGLLATHKLKFDHWAPVNVDTPPKRGTRFFAQRWAWDFLPGYELGCEWKGATPGSKRTRRVFIIATADTGYSAKGESEPDPGAFPPAEDCATKLRLALWTAETKPIDWETARRRRDKSAQFKAHGQWADGDYTCSRFDVDVLELVNESAVEGLVLAPVRVWLEATR